MAAKYKTFGVPVFVRRVHEYEAKVVARTIDEAIRKVNHTMDNIGVDNMTVVDDTTLDMWVERSGVRVIK